MEAYTGFAQVYDEYMDNIPYVEWTAYLKKLLLACGVQPGASIADLGCGTGTVTQLLEQAGYKMTGLDLSMDMLMIATEKKLAAGQQIVYTQQDMREFSLPAAVDAMVSIADSMNYITSVEDLKNVFRCVEKNLKKGGYFIFDLKTVHFFRDILADNTFAENREDSAFIWDNYYQDADRNNEYDLAVFVANEDGTFERFEETHFQHGFTVEEVRQAVQEAGLQTVAVYEAFTQQAPAQDSERLYFILRKQECRPETGNGRKEV